MSNSFTMRVMRRVLTAATAAIAITGCTSSGPAATHPAWCHQAQHLNLATSEPQRVQNAILLMTAMSLPGQPATFSALLAYEKAALGPNENSDAYFAVREGTAAAVILHRDCGY